ncbi:MAG: protein kinase [Pirellulaceae bacterium]|nr:protein kinase [Pirellulaceae bacterium]
MNEPLVHPAPVRLAAFARGELDLGEIDEIREHLAGCDSCCRAVDEVPDDRLLALVRQTGRLEEHVADRPAPHVDRNPAETAFGSQDHTNDEVSFPGSQPKETDPARDERAADDLPPELADHPRYRVLGQIGRGGMGDVYQAEHRLMQRTVALKVISQSLIGNPQAVERFRREVQTAASLSHPNIVSAFDAEQAGSVHYLVMEFVEGTNLAEMVKEQGPLAVDDAWEFIRQAVAGLQHAHERGMIHRDIKPHNLMLATDGTVKILDFGLASLTTEATGHEETRPRRGELTSVSTVIGTPDYISPEHASNAHQADARSDLYSLGATFYFLLAGQPPFTGGTVTGKLADHAALAPEPIQVVRPDVPDELAEIIHRLLAKAPGDRFQSATDLADVLDRRLSAPSVPSDSSGQHGDDSPSPSRRPERPRATSRHLTRSTRRWLVATATVSIVAVIVAGLFIGGGFSRRPHSERQPRTPVAKPKPAASAGQTRQPRRDDWPDADELHTAPLHDEFVFDFRGGKYDAGLLLRLGIESRYGANLFMQEERGLRILIPKGQAESKPRLGFAPELDIGGDFEITATYEILSAGPVRNDGPGVGPSLYLMAEKTTNSATFRRTMQLDGDAFWVSWRVADPTSERSTGQELFPANAAAGKLQLVRTGSVLSFLAQEEGDDQFRVLWQTEFGTTPIGLLRVESWAEGAQDTVDILWKDLTIRAEKLNASPPSILQDDTSQEQKKSK